MKAVSRTFRLQRLFSLPQGQIQGMFNEFGFMCQATFGDFEGKTSA